MSNTEILRPSGTGFEWCINQYDGCSHGCRYCYGMTIRRKNYQDWMKAKPRTNVIERLKKDIRKLKAGNTVINDIFLGSITDSYQPLEETHKLTRQVVEVLMQNELPFTILTKSDLILRDIDLLKNYKWCRIGVTITSLDEGFRRELEPNSVSYERRIATLKQLKDNRISTYLSCEPIFPVREVDLVQIIMELKEIADLFEFGMWSKYRTQGINEYYYKLYTDAYYVSTFRRIIDCCEQYNINYGLAAHSKDFIERNGLPYRTYSPLKA
jgi:DNA repair photolyase